MRKLAVALGALSLAFGALAEGSASAAGDAEARKLLADFFLRTKGMTRVVSASQVWEGMQSGKSKYRVVDVRSPEDFEKGHVPGALNLPLDVLFRPASLEQLPVAGDPILLVCHSGHMESMALGGLAALGYEPWVLRFGMIGWNAETKVKVAGSPKQEPDVVRGLGGPIEK
ncbi:MAG TPA: rhodanese-like domain-containing protein [Myxococcales bacterium]